MKKKSHTLTLQSKFLTNAFSSGGGGGHFEAHVQASLVLLMLTGGYVPCLPCWPIKEIKLQGKIDGFDTDDLIVFVEKNDSGERRKLLGQVKHTIGITQGNRIFSEVIQAAWSDFTNQQLFQKGRDAIALLTGPLNATDSHNVQWLLNHAKHTKSVDEFFRNVAQAKFSPPQSGEKLKVFQHHLKAANKNIDVSPDELYAFLNHFHWLGYDLGCETGVVLSLLHSHISQFNQQYPEWAWSRVVDIVQTWNQDAGTIIREKLPEDLRNAFKQPVIVPIPKELVTAQLEIVKRDWNQSRYATDLALTNLAGAWDEKNQADVVILSQLLREEYSAWVPTARDILHLPDSPFSLKNGLWKITDRVDLWEAVGSRIFDQTLDTFKTIVVAVLTEPNPAFDLPPDERFAASIHGKILAHSPALRQGLSEGLALLGCKPNLLVNCSIRKAETTAITTIREIFTDANWVLWASLDKLLPTLAEAAPDEFLKAVENALRLTPCPFDELFAQESAGITGTNYLSGLLWALEGLAWDEKHFVRVCIILGELANHDPGGKWANRPENSLTNILLPWLPQTLAPFEKRKVAVQTLCKEWPRIGWKLVIQLLPSDHQVSMGSHKPSWRNPIPDNWEKGVTKGEYWQQVSYYAEFAILLAGQNPVRLAELIDHFANLPKPAFDKLIKVLSSDAIGNLPEDQRLVLWGHLTRFSSRHRKYSDTKWALGDELLSPIEAVAVKIAPSNPVNLYQHLFSDHDHDLYERNGNWEKQQQNLAHRRQKAIEEILQIGGIESILQFAEIVESPIKVGNALGRIAETRVDSVLLPTYLLSEKRKLSQLANGYIWSRHQTQGWPWIDGLDKSAWTLEQIGQFLSFLPFTKEVWDRAAQWLENAQSHYWLRAPANPYQAKTDLEVGVDKLIEYGRPHAAISCLEGMLQAKQSIDVHQCVRALLTALSSAEPPYVLNTYQIIELIRFLQESPEVPLDDLFQIEWAYLPLLDRHQGCAPKLLENRLASDPEFFCEVVQLLYRSKKDNQPHVQLSENAKAVVSNAWRLFCEWQTVPGEQENNSVDDAQFSGWLERVKEICTESGHLEVALISIGKVLIYCPPDKDGLWINRAVAEALNGRDAEDLRVGFSAGIYNSRGDWVDPTGKPERELATQFRRKAEEIESAGFQRLAVTLREVADSYDREADHIIRQSNTEGEEE